VLQGQMGRHDEGCVAKQCRIKVLVRACRPRVTPSGVFAWHGELAFHASSRGSPCVGEAPRCEDRVLVGDGIYLWE
jgi:hypothetical protein